MTHCIDTEALLAVQEALAWDGTLGVTHLAECAACRSALAELELLRSATTPLEPDDAFVSRVTESLAVARAAGHLPAARVPVRVGAAPAPLLGLTLFVVCTTAIWFALSFVQAALGQPDGAGTWDPSLLLPAAAAGAAAYWRARRATEPDWTGPVSPSIAH